jgi:hypothetical protein
MGFTNENFHYKMAAAHYSIQRRLAQLGNFNIG